jgi:D-amino-acid oxidase
MYDVVVVGAGVVGLSCAIRLIEGGARVAVVTADELEQTVSWLAAAVWYPTRTSAVDPRVLRWATRTFAVLADQAGDVPGVVMRPTRMLLRGSTQAPWWAPAVRDFRIVQSANADGGPHTRSATSGAPGTAVGPHTGEWRFTVPSVEMGPYLNWQLRRVASAGGVLLRRRIHRFADVCDLAPAVVNATGLASRVLASDRSVTAIRGRIVVMSNPGIDVSVRDEDNPAGVTYVHPRSRDVVLGGTFEPGEDDLSPDPGVSRAIIERCTDLVPELSRAEVLSELAGLRPGRAAGARVESDPARLPGGARLIHNYGHGGAGVTLCWGCAEEVAALAV